MSSHLFAATVWLAMKVPERVVLVKPERSVSKNNEVPSVSTPVQKLAPGTTIVVAGINAPVEGLNWLYVQFPSPLLIRKLPFGRTVKPSEFGPAGPAIATGPLKTVPVRRSSLKTSSASTG